MFLYKFPIAVVTSMALLQPPVVIAQDFEEVNNIARNISVKITGHGNGSGFILEREGNVYSVVTNKHVVPIIDTKYEIQTYDGEKYRVTSRQEIPNLDLAIIQFESTEEYEVAELGYSDELQPRQFVSVAGFPGEQTDIDLIDGQIRSIRQEIIANPSSNQGYALIYTNQTLPGSSGGAVLDEDGRVVAINGEANIDNKTGRDISRGIPIDLFLEAEEKLLATENSSFALTTNSLDTSTPDNSSLELNTFSNYQLAYSTSETITYASTAHTVAISNNSFISGNLDNTIKIWNLVTGELERTLTGHSDSVNSVAVNNNKIISGSKDNTIKIWNLVTGELEHTLTLIGYSGSVNSVAVNDNKIISGSNNTIKIWNLATGELERTLRGHSSGEVNSVAVNGNKIISGGYDNKVIVWDLATGELERTLTGHSDSVNSVAVNNNKIISGSKDKTIKIWNLATGELERTLRNHSSSVNSVAVNGDKIISGSADNTIKVWQLQK